jgi:energy-coupling factor transport system permease protein
MQPYYHATDSFLHRLNPLSKVLVTVPLMVFLALTTAIYPPLVFSVLTTLLLVGGGRIGWRRFGQIALPMLTLVLGFVLLYPLFVRRALVQDSPLLFTLGPFRIYTQAILFGLAAGLRIDALLLLSLLFSLTTDAGDFVRALVQQWHLPYKIGYSALAALRFLPMLQHELRVIQAAHKVRGVADRSGVRAWLDQFQRYAIPLLATAIRQAERTALAMDGRAFGAFPQRTYYRQLHFAQSDYWFIGGCWLVSPLTILALSWAGWLGPLVLLQRV